jgi:hypothetical protein
MRLPLSGLKSKQYKNQYEAGIKQSSDIGGKIYVIKYL